MLGHVKIGCLDNQPQDPCTKDLARWQQLVDYLKIKAFVEQTLSSSIREGMHHLIRVSGLGGMKPNTICLGFYDDATPTDAIAKWQAKPRRKVRFYTSDNTNTDFDVDFPELRTPQEHKLLSSAEYVLMIQDVLKMQKNLCLFRHFDDLDKTKLFKNKKEHFVDVWPLNLFNPDTANYFDTTCLFLLQLACILHMVPGWKSTSTLRIFLCVDTQTHEAEKKEKKLSELLSQLRIPGLIRTIMWRHVTRLVHTDDDEEDPEEKREVELSILPGIHAQEVYPGTRSGSYFQHMSEEYTAEVNELIRSQCSQTSVVFMYLPRPPHDADLHTTYLHHLDIVTRNLPPTVLVHGLSTVTSTTL